MSKCVNVAKIDVTQAVPNQAKALLQPEKIQQRQLQDSSSGMVLRWLSQEQETQVKRQADKETDVIWSQWEGRNPSTEMQANSNFAGKRHFLTHSLLTATRDGYCQLYTERKATEVHLNRYFSKLSQIF